MAFLTPGCFWDLVRSENKPPSNQRERRWQCGRQHEDDDLKKQDQKGGDGLHDSIYPVNYPGPQYGLPCKLPWFTFTFRALCFITERYIAEASVDIVFSVSGARVLIQGERRATDTKQEHRNSHALKRVLSRRNLRAFPSCSLVHECLLRTLRGVPWPRGGKATSGLRARQYVVGYPSARRNTPPLPRCATLSSRTSLATPS